LPLLPLPLPLLTSPLMRLPSQSLLLQQLCEVPLALLQWPLPQHDTQRPTQMSLH
jgi:hypothetical protein